MTFNLLVKVALLLDEGLELFITVIVITCWFQIQHWFSNLSTSTVRRYFDQSILTLVPFSGMLRHGSPPNLHNLAKWYLKRIGLISRHEIWQTVLAWWP